MGIRTRGANVRSFNAEQVYSRRSTSGDAKILLFEKCRKVSFSRTKQKWSEKSVVKCLSQGHNRMVRLVLNRYHLDQNHGDTIPDS